MGRDCSIQRRNQKVIERAPAPQTDRQLILCEMATAICKQVRYECARTVEFLMDINTNEFFHEVNPRIQVEHTILKR